MADGPARFAEHYRVLQNEDGTPIELGRGAMGVTYKAFDVHLQCPVALKIINARTYGSGTLSRRRAKNARSTEYGSRSAPFDKGERQMSFLRHN